MKKYRTMKNLLFVLISLAVLAGCDEDPPDVKKDAPAIEINIQHLWNGDAFTLNNWYTTVQTDSFKPTTLNYHINDIFLVEADGSETQVTTWELVNYEQDGNKKLTLSGVEGKTFTKLKFTLGVEDSLVNVNGELNDDFTDPMYWGMAMGYINLKLEGKRMKDSVESGVYFHIGGYAGADQTARNIELDLTSDVSMVLGKNIATLNVDIEDFFHSPNPISLDALNDVQVTGSDAVMIAQNWDSMFSME
ncbi:MAG: hypothetical protein ACI9JN_002259 [Bacteroidia bacterium]|jgi:hypothetical protein